MFERKKKFFEFENFQAFSVLDDVPPTSFKRLVRNLRFYFGEIFVISSH